MNDYIYIVRFENIDESEIDSIFKSKENAEKRVKELEEQEIYSWIEPYILED